MESTVQHRFKTRNPQFRELVAKKFEGQHLMKHLGMELTVVDEAYVEAEAPLKQFLKQQDGMVHGGVTATMADIVCGFAAFSLVEPDQRVVTADLKISYFSPGRGEKVKARGWVVKPGKRLMFCEGEIMVVKEDGEEQVIAKTTSIMAVFRPSGQGTKDEGRGTGNKGREHGTKTRDDGRGASGNGSLS